MCAARGVLVTTVSWTEFWFTAGEAPCEAQEFCRGFQPRLCDDASCGRAATLSLCRAVRLYSTTMPLTQARLEELQADAMADDVQIDLQDFLFIKIFPRLLILNKSFLKVLFLY